MHKQIFTHEHIITHRQVFTFYMHGQIFTFHTHGQILYNVRMPANFLHTRAKEHFKVRASLAPS
jgi:hypothetical protein